MVGGDAGRLHWRARWLDEQNVHHLHPAVDDAPANCFVTIINSDSPVPSLRLCAVWLLSCGGVALVRVDLAVLSLARRACPHTTLLDPRSCLPARALPLVCLRRGAHLCLASMSPSGLDRRLPEPPCACVDGDLVAIRRSATAYYCSYTNERKIGEDRRNGCSLILDCGPVLSVRLCRKTAVC